MRQLVAGLGDGRHPSLPSLPGRQVGGLECVVSGARGAPSGGSPQADIKLAGVQVLWVDAASKQVRVQAGARVQDVVEALRPHGLTLQNYASIREQQIGGFTQVPPPFLTCSGPYPPSISRCGIVQ